MSRENIKDIEDEGTSGRNLRDIRMVIYGRKWSGKTFAANTILGGETLRLSESIENRVRVAEVGGRWRVQLVLTPGWWKPFLPNETMELVKLKMIQGVAQSGPAGPHALLLVIDTDTLMDETSARAVEQHMELLGGEAVWRHTVVILNAGIWHEGDPTAPEVMAQSGGFLGRIVRKCGGRHHLLNTDKTHPRQVLRLLEKLERMVDDNGGEAFRVDAALALSAETRLREVMEGVALRQATVPATRELLREMYRDHQLPEVRLLLMGWSLSGKSTLADAILGSPPGAGSPKGTTTVSTERRGRVGRWAVQTVDTPGWWRFGSTEDTPETVKQEILKGVWLAAPPGPHAVVLVVCACMAFTEAHLRAIRQHMAFLGPDVWRHTLVLFNWCDAIGDTALEEFIESEGRPLQWLLRRCGNRYHAMSSVGPGVHGEVEGLLEMVEWMAAGNSVLQVHMEEEEEWEGEGVVIETLPGGVPLMELFSQVCRKREKEFLESIRRILVRPKKANSIGVPPMMSDEEMESDERKVSEWLKGCDKDHDDDMAGDTACSEGHQVPDSGLDI